MVTEMICHGGYEWCGDCSNAVKTLGGGGADPLDEPAHGSEVISAAQFLRRLLARGCWRH